MSSTNTFQNMSILNYVYDSKRMLTISTVFNLNAIKG